jgi:hypothetical protein
MGVKTLGVYPEDGGITTDPPDMRRFVPEESRVKEGDIFCTSRIKTSCNKIICGLVNFV